MPKPETTENHENWSSLYENEKLAFFTIEKLNNNELALVLYGIKNDSKSTLCYKEKEKFLFEEVFSFHSSSEINKKKLVYASIYSKGTSKTIIEDFTINGVKRVFQTKVIAQKTKNNDTTRLLCTPVEITDLDTNTEPTKNLKASYQNKTDKNTTSAFQINFDDIKALSTYENHPENICIINYKKQDIIYANSNFKNTFGSDVLNKKCYEVIGANQSDCPGCKNNTLNSNIDHSAWEVYNEKHDKYFRISNQLVDTKSDNKICVSFILDITKEKKREHDLLEKNKELNVLSENYLVINEELIATNSELIDLLEVYDEIIEMQDNCIIVFDVYKNGHSFIARQFNRAARKLEGKTKEEVLNKEFAETLPTFASHRILNTMKEVWQTGDSKFFPMTLTKNSGEQNWRVCYIYKLTTGEIVNIYKDITQEEKAKRHKKKEKEHLDTLIDLLQLEISNVNDFLTISLEKAIAITESKTGFLFFCNGEDELLLLSPNKETNKTGSNKISKSSKLWRLITDEQKAFTLDNLNEGHALNREIHSINPSIKSILGVPVLSENGVVAALFVANKKENYTETDSLQLELLMGTVWSKKDKIKAQGDLIESKKRLELTLKSAKQGVFDINFATGESSFSDEYVTMLGFDPRTFSLDLKKWQERIHPSDTKKVFDAFKSYRDGKANEFLVEYRHLTAYKKYKWILAVGEFVEFDENNKPTRILGTNTDIDKVKGIESKLNESLANYSKLHENMYDSYIETNMTGVITNCNKSFGKLLGYCTHDLAGMRIEEITPKEWNYIDKEIKNELVQNEKFADLYEKVFLHKNGNEIPVELRSYLIQNDDKKNIGIYSIARDLTERKSIENQLKNYNKKLEQEVKERTKQLELANKELESFAYSVSHDLRAPLRNISGYASILSSEFSEKLDSEAQRLINVIIKNTKKTNLLIHTILEFSRLGRVEMRKKLINTNSLINEVYENLALKSKHNNVRFTIKENLPAMYGDPILMELLITNLLSNAIKFSSKEKFPQINVSGKSKNNHIEIVIEDNGVGFNTKYMNKLFDVFQRLHSEKDFPGTGAGLSIVKRIAERHGGEIKASSKIGEGATFILTLPNKTI